MLIEIFPLSYLILSYLYILFLIAAKTKNKTHVFYETF